MEAMDNSVLRLVGGHPALDLVNTVEPRVPGAVPEKDHLRTPEALIEWCVRTRVLREHEADRVARAWFGPQVLASVLTIREALFTVLVARLDEGRHQESAVAAALEELLLRHAAAVSRGRLSLAIGAPSPGSLAVGTAPEFAVQDRLAYAAIEVFTTANIDDFRICPLDEGGCGWLFLDRSRNHSRRWCAMADCGSRVKARRLTRRRQGTEAGTPEAD